MGTASSVRARVRAEMVEELKTAARRHLAAEGANLSLRAVARDLGMASSAVYRYFASRDDLLTALIIDAYNALGEAVERADAARPRSDLAGRTTAICHAVRNWALANPNEYALIYGSPVPGYRAPDDTIGPATRITRALARVLSDGVAAGVLAPRPDERLPRAVRADLARLREQDLPDIPEAVLARGMTLWIQLFGAVSFELFGRFQNTVENRDAFFEHQMRTMVRHVGLR